MYCRKSKGFSRILTTKLIHNIIPFITLVNISVGGYCRLDEQCQRSEHSAVCKDDRCVCKTGYILFNLKCHEGNLALNQSCSFSEQCAGSPYTSCFGGTCSCIEGYTAENATSCDQIKVSVGGYCKHDEQCQGSNHSGVCELQKCVCRAGYVLSNLECHEGNIVLNQSCSFRDQCAGSPYASCLGGICSCIEGYTAENATSCIQSEKSVLPKFQHQEEANIGTTLGALFGGLFLGVILTTVAAIIIYRRSETHVNKRDELTVKFSDNDACCSAKVVDSNALQNIQTKDKKARKKHQYTTMYMENQKLDRRKMTFTTIFTSRVHEMTPITMITHALHLLTQEIWVIIVISNTLPHRLKLVTTLLKWQTSHSYPKCGTC
eukprot:XP_011449683.1 PREDICTED: uncharacterized protein LOC105343881 isoform X1 [Crassostrea gigas]